MNKITANQTYDLMEAYNSIYEKVDLTEEQVIEDYNLWIDDLLAEGYDLSDYTSDELYEFYVTESGAAKILKGLGGIAARGLQSAGRGLQTAWKGYNKTTRSGQVKRVPGAAQALTSLGTRSVHAGLKYGIPLYVVNALTGGAVEKIGRHALSNLNKIGGAIPEPGESSGAAKPAPPKKEKPRTLKIVGGQVVGFNETYDDVSPMLEATTSDFALLNNRPGYIIKGPQGTQFRPINTASFDKKELDRLTADYVRRRGSEQVSRDLESVNRARANQETRRQQAPSQSAGASRPAPPAAPAGGSTAAPAAPTRPSGGTPAGSSTAAPAAPTRPATAAPQSSPANMSTADRIKSGMSVWSQQMKMGDTKGAADTGMGVWRMANPKLAAAADERARIRGTAQTDNPLMRGFRSRLPMNSPSVQSSDVANLGRGNQSLTQNPNAFRAAEPKATPAATTQQSQDAAWNRQAARAREARFASSLGGPASIPTSSLNRSGAAANPIRQTVIPQTQNRPMTQTQNRTVKSGPTAPSRAPSLLMKQSYEHDAYDIILEYLIDRGHVDTLDEANYLMLEMDETAIHSVLEEYKNYSLSVEISEWVDSLLDEGYDLSEYTWDDLVEYYMNEAKVDSGKSVEQKQKDREEREGGPIQHFLSRGVKTKGRKRNDYKYLNMQQAKKAAKKDEENAEYNERQRVETRGTWDKD